MNGNTLIWPADAPLAEAIGVLRRGRALGVPLRVIGHSRAPIIPQKVGSWWLEPLTEKDALPSRAAHRLRALRDSGIKPKAVALFHELPGQPVRQRRIVRQFGSAVRWAQQDLPVLIEQGGRAVRQCLTDRRGLVANAAPLAALVAMSAAGVAAVAVTSAAAVVGTALLADPCLVLVTEDGYWIEVDRWDE